MKLRRILSLDGGGIRGLVTCRWLTAVGKFTYGTYDYQGQNRNDKTYSLEGNLIYKLNRNIWIKGTLSAMTRGSAGRPQRRITGDCATWLETSMFDRFGTPRDRQ